MKKVLCIAIIIAAACAVAGFGAETVAAFSLHETPQIYVLQDENNFSTMPTVTLYENGNARLSQPPISSLALFDMGRYTVQGNELTVTHDQGATATFTISDHGDTLTLKSTNVGFTTIGAVYQYRANAAYLAQCTKTDGEPLTVDALRELAKKAPNLTMSAFETFAHYDIAPDDHIFDVDSEYMLRVTEYAGDGINCTVERNADGERFPLHLNGSTNLVFDAYLGLTHIPEYKARKWLDYYQDDEMPWDSIQEITLPEFPGAAFAWSYVAVQAGDEELFLGMPIWNVYLADLTNDGKPELCATVSIGSGIVDTRVIVYDYATDTLYDLNDRMHYDYFLSMQDGRLMVTQTKYSDSKPLMTAELQLINGEIARFGYSAEALQQTP